MRPASLLGAGGRGRGWIARMLPIAAGMVLGALVMLVGLAQAGRLAPQDPQAIVALAQQVQTVHRKVDLLLQRNDVEAAIESLEDMRTLPWPNRERGGDLGMELRHDIYGRLARLRLDNPDVDSIDDAALLVLIDEGLGDDPAAVDPNPFTARLIALRGETFEAQGRDDDALTAYEQALDINRILLERELGDPSP
ncbi:MAG: hypothetical protein JKY37_20610 [Nannocystaceae bacterium]|nr:hypothetical protein [Nannocystaceae bacterium]